MEKTDWVIHLILFPLDSRRATDSLIGPKSSLNPDGCRSLDADGSQFPGVGSRAGLHPSEHLARDHGGHSMLGSRETLEPPERKIVDFRQLVCAARSIILQTSLKRRTPSRRPIERDFDSGTSFALLFERCSSTLLARTGEETA